MPYIDKKQREEIRLSDGYFDAKMLRSPGDLNYIFTEIAKVYIDRYGTSYRTYNDIVGALELCKLEFNRRLVAPYEDKKIEENGDVYFKNDK